MPVVPVPGISCFTCSEVMYVLNSGAHNWPAGIVFGPGTVSGAALQIDGTGASGPCASAKVTLTGQCGTKRELCSDVINFAAIAC